MQMFAPEDRVLIQAVTGGKSKWNRLGLVCDMAETLRGTVDLDWPLLLRRARDLGCERMLFLAVRLASEVLDAPVPRTVRSRCEQDSSVRALSSTVQARMYRDSKPDGVMPRFPWKFSSIAHAYS